MLNLLAPAKINLCLHILNRRDDGYHNLSMIMEKISLCDEIVLEKIPSGIELYPVPFTLYPVPDVPKEKNLAYRAVKLLQEVSGFLSGVRIKLIKNIPIGGGLGGGSSDAAQVLKGLNQLWDLHWPVSKLAELGVKLGADIPFFLSDGPAKVEGIGDKISPLNNFPKLSIILINPGIHVSTPWAYQTWDTTRHTEPRGNALTPKGRNVTSPSTFAELFEILHNDFERVVFKEYPEIQVVKKELLRAGAKGALMSGSGSTVFGLFETKEERDWALQNLQVKPNWQVFAVENRLRHLST